MWWVLLLVTLALTIFAIVRTFQISNEINRLRSELVPPDLCIEQPIAWSGHGWTCLLP